MILGSDVNDQLAELDALRSGRSLLEARVAELERALALRQGELRRVKRELAAARSANGDGQVDGSG